MRKIVLKQDNIWDMPTFERFLRLLHDDYVSFSTVDMAAPLRSNRDLVRFVTSMCSKHAESIRSMPEYKQVSHSRRVFSNLIECGRLVYEKCIKKLPNLWSNFDLDAACLTGECFREIPLTVESVFKKKANEFLKGIDFQFESGDREHKK